jgi:lipase
MSQGSTLKFDSPKVARLYKDVPTEQVERLHQFRADHPYRRVTINGAAWEYIDAGHADRTVLILTGALGTAESSWQTIVHFADRLGGPAYRAIAPSYPYTITKMGDLADGLAGLLDACGVEKADVVGGSAGGYVAQVFVRRHPDRTGRLVVSHAGVPKPERGEKIRKALLWFPLMPMGVLRAIIKKRLVGLLPEDHPEMAFIYAYLQESIRYQLTKKGLIATMRRGADFDLHFTFEPGDLVDWLGEVLLIMADNDPSTPGPIRDAMTGLYPRARVHLFHGTKHAAPILKREEYLGVLDSFLS